MDRQTAIGTLCSVVAAGGVAAMIGATALSEHSAYFDTLMYGGAAAIALGLGGLIWLVVVPRRPPSPTPRPISTTVKVRGKGKIDLEDFVSKADTFADVDDFESISVRRGLHDPHDRDLSAGSKSPKPDDDY